MMKQTVVYLHIYRVTLVFMWRYHLADCSLVLGQHNWHEQRWKTCHHFLTLHKKRNHLKTQDEGRCHCARLKSLETECMKEQQEAPVSTACSCDTLPNRGQSSAVTHHAMFNFYGIWFLIKIKLMGWIPGHTLGWWRGKRCLLFYRSRAPEGGQVAWTLFMRSSF